jgi:hypothetical protein
VTDQLTWLGRLCNPNLLHRNIFFHLQCLALCVSWFDTHLNLQWFPLDFHPFLFRTFLLLLDLFFSFFKGCPGRRERTRHLLISFIFSFHSFTAEPQRLPIFDLISMDIGSYVVQTCCAYDIVICCAHIYRFLDICIPTYVCRQA